MIPLPAYKLVGFFIGLRSARSLDNTMTRYLLIAFGGGIGSLLRYMLAGWGQKLTAGTFPVGTLLVNVLGCLFLGFLNAAFSGPIPIKPEYRIAITIGLLGGFTTFSTFGWETFSLANDGQFLQSAMNLLLSVTLGLAAVWIGIRLAERLFGI